MDDQQAVDTLKPRGHFESFGGPREPVGLEKLAVMQREVIAEIEIDGEGRLHVVPASREFPQIYREAMEVRWDAARRSLRSPVPREWSYTRWLQQILAAARAQGCDLRLEGRTRWINVPPAIRAEMLQQDGE